MNKKYLIELILESCEDWYTQPNDSLRTVWNKEFSYMHTAVDVLCSYIWNCELDPCDAAEAMAVVKSFDDKLIDALYESKTESSKLMYRAARNVTEDVTDILEAMLGRKEI